MHGEIEQHTGNFQSGVFDAARALRQFSVDGLLNGYDGADVWAQFRALSGLLGHFLWVGFGVVPAISVSSRLWISIPESTESQQSAAVSLSESSDARALPV